MSIASTSGFSDVVSNYCILNGKELQQSIYCSFELAVKRVKLDKHYLALSAPRGEMAEHLQLTIFQGSAVHGETEIICC